jgi:hypothetical protein
MGRRPLTMEGEKMKRTILAIIGLALLLTAKVYAYDDGDFQVWNTDVEELKVNDKIKIALEEEFRWGDNASEFYYQHYDVGFVYSLNKHLDLGLNYRQVYEKKKGKFKEENRPHLNAILKYDFYGFKLDDRNRLEYRHFDYQADSWRYRNKFTIRFPWKFTKLEIQPYLADEIFLDFQNKAFSRNRFYSGIGMNFTKNLKGEIYYLLQSSRSGNIWTDANVLGTKLKLAF